ncbi:MAG: phosphoribosyltransferase family protein [Pseudomonadota bacterium]|nr:phosphoribosyltransferase family protein [Pseudomonadota bacterium]
MYNCQRCGLLLGYLDSPCPGGCSEHLMVPWQHLLVPFVYQGPIRDVLLRFKYQSQPILAKVLAGHWYPYVRNASYLQQDMILLPVPMHWLKSWRRGYNHAALLAEVLSGMCQLNMQSRWFYKKTVGVMQQGLSRSARLRNLSADDFYVSYRLNGKTVILIDDVVTTTATIRACTDALLRHGVEAVYVWALAKTLR